MNANDLVGPSKQAVMQLSRLRIRCELCEAGDINNCYELNAIKEHIHQVHILGIKPKPTVAPVTQPL